MLWGITKSHNCVPRTHDAVCLDVANYPRTVLTVYVDIYFPRCIVYSFPMRFHSRRISFNFIRKPIIDARRSKIGRFHTAFKSFAASYPLGKSAAAGAACFCRDFTYVVVAIGARTSRKSEHAHGATARR